MNLLGFKYKLTFDDLLLNIFYKNAKPHEIENGKI